MAELTRFGISIDERLLNKFDALIDEKGYSNRSEAIRDLIRNALVEEEWGSGNEETVGTVSLVYDHHTRDLMGQLTHLQHSFEGEIKSVLHIHLDHHNCLEVLVVQGRGRVLKAFADKLESIRGVKYGALSMATTGKFIPSKADYHHHHHPHEK